MASTHTDTTTAESRIVVTRSGSRYRIQGRTVTKLTDPAHPTYELVEQTRGRLTYSDGVRLFISSPIVPI